MQEKSRDTEREAKVGLPEAKRELRERLFDRALFFLLTFLFAVMLGVVMLQVLVRYGAAWTNIRVPWTGEVARYLLVVTAFLGSAVAWRKRDNITVTALTDLLPRKVRCWFDLLQDVTILIFAVICIVGSYGMGRRMAGARLGSLGFVRMGHLYMALGVCFVFIAIYMVRWIIRDIRDLRALRREAR